MSVISPAAATPAPTSAIDSGATLFAASEQRLNQDAQQIATPGSDPLNPLVDLNRTRLDAQAAVEIIRTSNAMLGTLLDIRA